MDRLVNLPEMLNHSKSVQEHLDYDRVGGERGEKPDEFHLGDKPGNREAWYQLIGEATIADVI